MSKAMRVHQTGGPEALVWEEVPAAAPKAGEAVVRHTAVGVNFIDIYYRSGLYPAPDGAGVQACNAAAAVTASQMVALRRSVIATLLAPSTKPRRVTPGPAS